MKTAAALQAQTEKLHPETTRLKHGWTCPQESPGAQGGQGDGGGCQAALRAQGCRAARISQLMRDCEQYPPRNPAQRRRQTPQDLRHEKRNNHASKHRETHRSSATFMMIANIDNTNDALITRMMQNQLYRSYIRAQHRLLEQVG